jgi:type IV pilus assembly protein PilV
MSRISCSHKSAQRGVVLIEAMVAILLFSIGVLAVAGLQASMLRNTSDSKYRADASYIAQQKIGQMYSDMDGTFGGAYNTTDTSPLVEPLLPDGKIFIRQEVAKGPYIITVGWTAPGESPTDESKATCKIDVAHCYTALASISPYCYAGEPNC